MTTTTDALELLRLLVELDRLLAEIERAQNEGTRDYLAAVLAEDTHADALALRQRLVAGLLPNLGGWQ